MSSPKIIVSIYPEHSIGCPPTLYIGRSEATARAVVQAAVASITASGARAAMRYGNEMGAAFLPNGEPTKTVIVHVEGMRS